MLHTIRRSTVIIDAKLAWSQCRGGVTYNHTIISNVEARKGVDLNRLYLVGLAAQPLT